VSRDATDERRKQTLGYGDGYTDGWQSVTGSGPVPPHLGIASMVPPDLTVYEYGYENGRAGALEAKRMK
jgi:hypothetical protein